MLSSHCHCHVIIMIVIVIIIIIKPFIHSYIYFLTYFSLTHTPLHVQGIAEGLAKVQSPPFRARPGSSSGGGVGGGGSGGGGNWIPRSGGVIRSEYDERGVGRDDERGGGGGGGGGRERSSSSDSRVVGLRPPLLSPGQGSGLQLGLAGALWGSPTYSYSGAPRSGGVSGGGYGSSSSSGTTSRGGGTGINTGGGSNGHNSSSSSSDGDGSFFSTLFSRIQETWFGPGTRASSSEGIGRGFSVVGVGEWTTRQVQQRFRTW